MNDTAANALLSAYYDLFHKRGYAPERCDLACKSYPHLTDVGGNRPHIMWMCQEARTITDPERKQRWLGFIQGCLWMDGLRSIEELMGEVILAQDASA